MTLPTSMPFVVTTMEGEKAVALATTPEQAVANVMQQANIGVREVYRVLPFDHPVEIKARKREARP